MMLLQCQWSCSLLSGSVDQLGRSWRILQMNPQWPVLSVTMASHLLSRMMTTLTPATMCLQLRVSATSLSLLQIFLVLCKNTSNLCLVPISKDWWKPLVVDHPPTSLTTKGDVAAIIYPTWIWLHFYLTLWGGRCKGLSPPQAIHPSPKLFMTNTSRLWTQTWTSQQ